jgi:hypothetical protein
MDKEIIQIETIIGVDSNTLNDIEVLNYFVKLLYAVSSIPEELLTEKKL